MIKKVFISGRMTGLENYNRALFNQVANDLEEMGLVVLNPAILPTGLEHEEYMTICKAMIDCSDAMFMLLKWRMSKSATEEYEYAKAKGKTIIDGDDMRKFYKENKSKIL